MEMVPGTGEAPSLLSVAAGGGGWSGCAALPDGRVAFAPYNARSILLFDPADKSWEEVGDFEGEWKWNGCAALPVGLVVMCPFGSEAILVAEHASWHAGAQRQQSERQAADMARRMWEQRSYPDAFVDAGGRGACQRAIPVHREVLASRSEFFARMFAGPFREASCARVALPEEPEVVEAVLEHTYTGTLPPHDPLRALPLAHRLGLRECVAASALAIDDCDAAGAVRTLAPLIGEPAVNAAWARLKSRLRKDAGLLDSVLRELARAEYTDPAPTARHADVAVQTEHSPSDDGTDGSSSSAFSCRGH